MQNISQEANNLNPVYVVDTSTPGVQDFMGRATGAILRYVGNHLLKSQNAAWVYAEGSLYPLRVVVESPQMAKKALASVMPGISGDTTVRMELYPENIRHIGIDPACLDEIVATEARVI